MCTGVEEDGDCDTSGDCNPGLWCDTHFSPDDGGICESDLEPGARCVNDDSCGYNALCYDNFCEKFTELPDGFDLLKAGGDVERYKWLCETFNAVENTRGDVVCIEGAILNGDRSFPDTESERMCNYTIYDEETRESYNITDIPPKCGINTGNDLYCPAYAGDLVELIDKDIFGKLKDFFQGHKYSCNVMSHLWTCRDIFDNMNGDMRLALRAFYYLQNPSNYPNVASNPKCVKEN